jgi:hypothetical protein
VECDRHYNRESLTVKRNICFTVGIPFLSLICCQRTLRANRNSRPTVDVFYNLRIYNYAANYACINSQNAVCRSLPSEESASILKFSIPYRHDASCTQVREFTISPLTCGGEEMRKRWGRNEKEGLR